MKPAPFDYVAATSREHALDLLAGAADAKVLAGGQSLLPVLSMRLGHPEVLVDIGRIRELREVTVDSRGSLVIGASATQASVLTDPRVHRGWPLLTAAIRHIGHPQIRNRGTVCGSLAHNDPAAELPAAALALDASMRVASARGRREIAAGEMFLGPFTTALEPDELLEAVVLAPARSASGSSFREFSTRRGDFATVGVAVHLVRDGGVVAEVRVVLLGAAGSATRVRGVEDAVLGRAVTPELCATLPEIAAGEMTPPEDVHATAEFRTEQGSRLVAEAVLDAWETSA